MSSTQQSDRQAGDHRGPDRGDIDLGSGRRTWLVPALVGVVVLAAAVALIIRLAGGSGDDQAVGGSRFGNDFKIAYQASSASEGAFLDYLDKEIAPKYGVKITGEPIEDGNQLDQATADGQYIANIYQHKHWLAQVTSSTGMKLTALGPVFQWSYSA